MGVVFLIIGTAQQFRSFIEKTIKFRAAQGGVKPQITDTTIASQKMLGIFLIIFGIGLLVVALTNILY